MWSMFFFFNDTATTEIYTLSLHDALPIYEISRERAGGNAVELVSKLLEDAGYVIVVYQSPKYCLVLVVLSKLVGKDRKSTRLNSSHSQISYAVFCLKKKNKNNGVWYYICS